MVKEPESWIGVEQVAEEMNLTPRAAWEFVKRIGVEKTDDRPSFARFRRRDFEAARDRAMKPAPPRARRPATPSAPVPAAPISSSEAKAAQNLAKLERLRR